MFPATFIQNAGYKVSLRVQSERSELYSPGQLCTPPVSFADSPLEEGAFCLPLRGRWLPQADGRSVYNKFRSRLMNFPYEYRVSGAAECLRCQFAPVAPLRSALHSYRSFTTRGLYLIDTFTTRGLYLIDRCSFDSVVLQVYPMRNYHFRHTGVLFPVTLVTIAGYKVSLRVQSERSERLRELPSAGTHRSLWWG